MPTTAKKENRIEFRVQTATKEILELAASLQGQTLSAYAVATLVEDARRIIERHNRIQVTHRDHQHFLSVLDHDESPNRALADAAHDYLEQPRSSPRKPSPRKP
ncbi:MAG: DUF1778 domain-containing protein [bacterium]